MTKVAIFWDYDDGSMTPYRRSARKNYPAEGFVDAALMKEFEAVERKREQLLAKIRKAVKDSEEGP